MRSIPQSLAQQTSAIVVAYNSGQFLQECIASLYNTHPEVEIIIVDNASTDGAVVRAKAEFPAVEVVRNIGNAGFGAGCNLGMASAGREYLAFLNPDTVVTDGWLQALVCPLIEDPSIGLVTPKVLMRDDGDRINVAGLNVHLSGISMCRGLGLPRTALAEPAEVAAISGVAFAARREVFRAVGGFDEDFFLYMEDVDLSLRTWLAGYRCLYVPEALVLHDYETVKVDTRKTFWVERGRYLMLLKAFRWRTLMALLPVLFLAEVLTWGWLLWRNPRAVTQKLRAWWWVLTHWGEIAEKRRQVEGYRAAPDTVFLSQCSWDIEFGQLSGPGMIHAAKTVFDPLLRGAFQIAHLALG
jgi:GT2 family glycosyltransferase